ncbi:glycosyltransferase, partial [Tritonibacter sp. SIMBA_163]|uniref:glycosyltransferase n=1 Tax=Tritonibacter sp. SIMBA_163 TaxID=3080868 RepID=UPI0039803549
IMNKVTWIPNGIENHWLDSELNLKNLKEKSLNIIQVGGLNKNKNAETTIELVKRLKDNDIKANLLIIGKGPQEDILKEMCVNKKLDNVDFAGHISDAIKLKGMYEKS